MKKTSNVVKRCVALFFVLAFVISTYLNSTSKGITVKASSPYDTNYNIVDTVNYAVKWYNRSDYSGTDYEDIHSWAENDCACFVSECLTKGGIKINKAYREKKNILQYKYYNTEWSVANDQYKHFKGRGYNCEEVYNNGTSVQGKIHIGDLVYYDWIDTYADGPNKGKPCPKQGDKIEHASICIGIDSNGIAIIAEHNPKKVRRWDKTQIKKIRKAYVIHMTNAVGHKDVTNKFVGKTISIKSTKNNRYVSSDTDNASSTNTIAIANRTSIGSWEQFKVIQNTSVSTCGTIYPISLKTYTGRYLSSYIGNNGAPLKNTGNNSTWEAFRIFNQGNDYYLLSLINGKFVQVRDDNKLYAAGEGGWTWETFAIKDVTSNNTSSTTGKSYFKKCGSGYSSIVDALKSIGVDSSFNYRKKIAAANGISNYSGTASQNNSLLNKLKAGTLIKP